MPNEKPSPNEKEYHMSGKLQSLNLVKAVVHSNSHFHPATSETGKIRLPAPTAPLPPAETLSELREVLIALLSPTK